MSCRIKIVNVISGVLCLMLIVPILIVLIMSFGKSSYMIFPPTSLSVKWYVEFFSSPEWMNSLFSSLVIAVLSSLIATTLGFLGAYLLVRGRYGSQTLIISFCLLSLFIPTIITSVALHFVSVPIDLPGCKVCIALCHAALSLPVVLLLL